jgi:hypothetical protein
VLHKNKTYEMSAPLVRSSPFIVILTTDQARTIYRLRSASTAEGGSLSKSVAGKSSLVAEMFGVSPKTIRDVWNRKTWIQVSFEARMSIFSRIWTLSCLATGHAIPLVDGRRAAV